MASKSYEKLIDDIGNLSVFELADLVKALEDKGQVRLVGTPIPKSFIETATQPVSPTLRRALFIGRLAPEKDLEILIEASRELPDVHFQLGGDGPLRSVIEQHAKQQSNFEYLGWLERSKVMETIDQTDLLVLPSKIESFGTVAMEALLRERNALVSSECGIKNWSGLAGNLFIWDREQETFAEAIRKIAKTSFAVRQKMATDGRTASVALNRKTIHQWLDIFHEIVNDSPEKSPVVLRRAI